MDDTNCKRVVWRCKKCTPTKIFNRNCEYTKHYRDSHAPRIQCHHCDALLRNKQALQWHQALCHSPPGHLYVCEKCEKPTLFRSEYGYKQHVLGYHYPPKTCGRCGSLVKQGRRWRSHKKMCEPAESTTESRPKYMCPICFNLYEVKCHLTRHLNDHDKIKGNHRCWGCGRMYLSRWGLEDHAKLKHGGVIPPPYQNK